MSTAVLNWRFPQKPPGGVPRRRLQKWIIAARSNEHSYRSLDGFTRNRPGGAADGTDC